MAELTRRQRLREEMHREILDRARDQIEAGGVDALSLNAIAREIGTSGPALYRYFASRDELLAAVVASAYEDLAATLDAAATAARRRRPPARFRAVAEAYRSWAIAQPELYRLIFSEPVGSGSIAPELIVPASHRGMMVLIEVLRDVRATPLAVSGALERQIVRWARSREGPPASPVVLARALAAWTRLHGVISLELAGALEAMGLDGALLYEAEIDAILAL